MMNQMKRHAELSLKVLRQPTWVWSPEHRNQTVVFMWLKLPVMDYRLNINHCEQLHCIVYRRQHGQDFTCNFLITNNCNLVRYIRQKAYIYLLDKSTNLKGLNCLYFYCPILSSFGHRSTEFGSQILVLEQKLVKPVVVSVPISERHFLFRY